MNTYTEQIKNNNLKALRGRTGIKQQHISQILGFCINDRISHWEKGKALPSVINLFRLSAVLGVLPHEVYPELYKQIVSDVDEKIDLINSSKLH